MSNDLLNHVARGCYIADDDVINIHTSAQWHVTIQALHSKMYESNFESGRATIASGKLTHSCHTQFNCIYQVAPMCTPKIYDLLGPPHKFN